MKEQEFRSRKMGGGWIGAKAGGKCGGAARLAEAHVNGFDKGN